MRPPPREEGRIIILVVAISCLYPSNIRYKGVVKHSNVGHKFIYVCMYVKSQDYGDVSAGAQQGRLTMS